MTDRDKQAIGRHAASQASRMRRGIALVVVLWTLLLLSLIAAGFIAVTRTELRLARNALDNARAEALADAGVYRGDPRDARTGRKRVMAGGRTCLPD